MSAGAGTARLALVAVTAIWGSTFVVVHAGLAGMSPLLLVAGRFGVAALVLAVAWPRARREAWRLRRRALPLVLANFAGMTLQTVGLETTTPARAAFLTSLAVVLVPLLAWLAGAGWPRPATAAAVALATAGVYVLFQPFRQSWSRGDGLALACALAFAFYVIELGRLSPRHGPGGLVLVQMVGTALLAALLSPLLETPRLAWTGHSVATLAYLALVCTALTYALMSLGQARVPPSEAVIIYAFEPVFAALFAVAAGREAMTLKLVAGGGLILAAILLSSRR